MILRLLLYKIFRLEPVPCASCEVLREALTVSERERRELLQRLLAPPTPIPVELEKEELTPITPKFIPWRVRQQMLEQEDQQKAKLMRDKQKEIDDLEKETGIKDASKESKAI